MKHADDLNIELKPFGSLKPNPRNARTYTDRQIDLIAKSIAEFGFTNPIIIDEDDNILAGHARHAAATTLEMTQVPTIKLGHMCAAQKRAYVLADNKLAELAGWDFDILGEELGLLLDEDINCDMEVIGFDTAEIDQLVFGTTDKADAKEQHEEPVELPGDERWTTLMRQATRDLASIIHIEPKTAQRDSLHKASKDRYAILMIDSSTDISLAGTPDQWRDAQDMVDQLSRREKQVLDLMALGLRNREIGEELGISFRTVEIHRGNAKLKLKARTSGEAIRLVIYAALAQSAS